MIDPEQQQKAHFQTTTSNDVDLTRYNCTTFIVMFKKANKIKRANFRSMKKRESNKVRKANDTEEANSTILTANKKRFRKKTRSTYGSSSEDDDQDTTLLQEYIDYQAKEKSKNSTKMMKADIMHQYTPSASGPNDKELATRSAEHHPEEKQKNDLVEGRTEINENSNKKLYEGNKEKRSKFLAGPLKAPTFVRTTSRFDYQPDICKDYKDTGFCGFGDSCIYLHDRGNTLTGWQLEQEYERKKKEVQDQKEREMELFCQEVPSKASNDDNDISIVDDSIPFACHLCRGPFQEPISTPCGHYFCSECIKKFWSTENTYICPICSKDTHGICNHATKLVSKKRRLLGSKSNWQDFAEFLQANR